jgi:hypothetical protein
VCRHARAGRLPTSSIIDISGHLQKLRLHRQCRPRGKAKWHTVEMRCQSQRASRPANISAIDGRARVCSEFAMPLFHLTRIPMTRRVKAALTVSSGQRRLQGPKALRNTIRGAVVASRARALAPVPSLHLLPLSRAAPGHPTFITSRRGSPLPHAFSPKHSFLRAPTATTQSRQSATRPLRRPSPVICARACRLNRSLFPLHRHRHEYMWLTSTRKSTASRRNYSN